MRVLKVLGIGLLLLLTLPLLPVVGVVWGVLTLRSTDPRRRARRPWAIGAIVAGILGALVIWPGMATADDTETAATTATETATATDDPPSSPTPTTTPSPSSSPARPTTVPAPPPPAAPQQPEPEPTPTHEPETSAADLVPVVGIADGDTIRVRVDGVSERVRVIGIDTPEMPGGCYAQQATSRMQSLVQSRSVRLVADPTQDDRDRYDRLLRHVVLEDGRSVAEVLIAGGYGHEYTYRDAYEGQQAHRAAEQEARDAGLGLWSACPAAGSADDDSGSPGTTSDAAAARSTGTDTTARSAVEAGGAGSSCDIKGNINREGEKIYHVPGGRSYEDTKIDEGNGERWFCSESEARDAGWRAARR